MIKIAYILTPVEFGGSEKVNLIFLRNVDRSQFDIYPIIFIRPWEEDTAFVKQLEEANYPIYKIPVAKKPRNEGREYFRIARCLKTLYGILSKEALNLVHTHGYFADIVGMPVSKILGIPTVSTCHGFISNDRNLKIYNTLDRFSLRFSNKVICVSDSIKSDLTRSGIKKSRIVVIQNAVERRINDKLFLQNREEKRQLLNIKENEFVLGYIGRLSKEKGIKYLIEASSMLNDLNIPVKVVIIGRGPQMKDLEYLAKEKGIESKVIFTGFQNDVENWIPALDVFVLPSLTEGTPISLLEAMGYGIPVVASAVGGIPQVIDSGKNGILVLPGKPGEIKDAIHTFYSNENLRNSISLAAQQFIAVKHSVGDWIRKIEGEYLNLIKRRK